MKLYENCSTICLVQNKHTRRTWEYDKSIYELIGIEYTKKGELICCYTFKVLKKNCDYNDDKNCIVVVSKNELNETVESFYYDELTNMFINKNNDDFDDGVSDNDEEIDMLTSSCCVIS
jgi:hypothetical protein